MAGAGQWAKRALAASQRLGNPSLEATASAMVVFREYDDASVEAAGIAADRASALVDSLDDGALPQRLDGPFYLTWADSLLERFDDALRHCERAIVVSRALGQGQ